VIFEIAILAPHCRFSTLPKTATDQTIWTGQNESPSLYSLGMRLHLSSVFHSAAGSRASEMKKVENRSHLSSSPFGMALCCRDNRRTMLNFDALCRNEAEKRRLVRTHTAQKRIRSDYQACWQ